MEHSLIIINIFSKIEDTRRETKNKLYPLMEILLVAFATLLSGGENYEDMKHFGRAKLDFFRTMLPFENGIPSADTFERVFSSIRPVEFEKCLNEWVQQLKVDYSGDIISVDGKTVRGSKSKAVKPIHLVNAWANKNRLVLGCKLVDKKTNEITAIPEVLKMLSLKGTMTTMDAMGCQVNIANQIVEAEGDYFFCLKGNNGLLHDDVKTFFELEPEHQSIDHYESLEKNHGRIERRNYGFSPDVSWLTKMHPKWHTIKTIGFVRSRRFIDGINTEETRFFITSRVAPAEHLAFVARSHWGVENLLHNFLDVTLREDQCRVRDQNAATNLSILRRMVVGRIEERKDSKRSKRVMRLAAGWDNDYLKTLLMPAL
jgi:predicted transposase YbfD/YdcC